MKAASGTAIHQGLKRSRPHDSQAISGTASTQPSLQLLTVMNSRWRRSRPALRTARRFSYSRLGSDLSWACGGEGAASVFSVAKSHFKVGINLLYQAPLTTIDHLVAELGLARSPAGSFRTYPGQVYATLSAGRFTLQRSHLNRRNSP